VLIELYIFTIAILAYGIFITLAIIGFGRLSAPLKIKENSKDFFISIIASAKNEAENIIQFITELEKQSYPKQKFELIIIDDHSSDNTFSLALETLKKSTLNYQLIKKDRHFGKKRNLTDAINLSKGSVIITTDADVTERHKDWLATIAVHFTMYDPNLLIMPIDYIGNRGLLTAFQIVENFALSAITAGFTGIKRPFLCNGANLAFSKSAFNSVSGYTNHVNISSGEDVFLLEDLKKLDANSIQYGLKQELIVKTKAVSTIKVFFEQRIRWAYKSKYNPNSLNLFASFIIVITNLLFVALLAAIYKKSVIIPYLSIFIVAKLIFDFLLLFLAANFLGRKKYIVWFLPFELLYWLYSIIIAIASLFVKPYWKGIKVK
jgi:poly-beta-1,6-N-acetyl-D-glucosamine synthase